MIKFVTVWFLIVAEGRDGYKYEIPYASQQSCQVAAEEQERSWDGRITKCVKGELPVAVVQGAAK